MIRKKPALGLDPRVDTSFPKRSRSTKMPTRMVTDLPFIVNRGIDLFTMPLLLFERASAANKTDQTNRGTPC
jgi:hypothetical protein